MPLVTRIISDCPSCGAANCFGNVSVTGGLLRRGCMNCSHADEWPLTPVIKKVLYLDQFFFSRAFRLKAPAQDQKYADAVARIRELASKQVLVVPYGSIHADETHQWAGDAGQTPEDLMDFIKATSGGHKLKRAISVQHAQIFRAFSQFISGAAPAPNVAPLDALPHNLHRWTDYIWIDVPGYWGNVEGIRGDKNQTVANLAAVLPEWRASTSSFEANVALELRDSAQAYVDAYSKRLAAQLARDVEAIWRAPADALVIEGMLLSFPNEVEEEDRLRVIGAFFRSEHFTTAPYVWVWSHALAVLKERIKQGAYSHPQKGPARLRGYFQDIEFIATYAPYCDAIFIDKAMEEMMRDPRINISRRFQIRVFSETSWDTFVAWLNELDKNLSPEHEFDLKLAYPASIADPIAVMRARMAADDAG